MEASGDITLVTRVVVLGQKSAFDQLVRKYQSDVRRFFLNLTGGDRDLSDDLAQETFLKVYENLRHFKALSSFKTWMFRIAYNQFYDYLRTVRPAEDLEQASYTPVAPADAGTKIDVYRALAQVDARERLCLVLFYMQDRSIKQITQITSLPEGTVKSLLHRGREKMETYLRQNGYGK